MAAGQVKCGAFTDYLIRKIEHLDEEMLKTIVPTDQLMGMVESGPFPAYNGTTHEFDRIERVVPDLTGAWARTTSGSCVGTPCDPDAKKIGFGSTRESYFLEQRSYESDLFCFDEIMTADRAIEQFAGIVMNLKEATVWVVSDWIRLSLLRIAGKKWLASAALTDFTYTWDANYENMTVSALPTSKLTPAMLQRRVQPLAYKGAMGMRPKGAEMSLELITDMDTLYAMEQGNTSLQTAWRFKEFDSAAKEFYKYGWAGRIGNYNVHTDLFPMRFVLASGTTLKRVFPYKTEASTLGIKSVDNDDYILASYQISFIHHPSAMKHLTLNPKSVNPMMPFLNRDLAGKWQFVMDNLGADANGCVIDNKRRNKGMFIADFKFSAKPWRTEWEEAILHQREPICVTVNPLCDPSLLSHGSEGNYDSANALCTRVFVIPISVNGSGNYQVLADTISCNGQAIDHAAINAVSRAALVIALNSVAGSLGTWAADPESATSILLTGNGCLSVNVPFVAP